MNRPLNSEIEGKVLVDGEEIFDKRDSRDELIEKEESGDNSGSKLIIE